MPAFQWLDDAQLAALSTAEVEDVLDRYLLSVVQQLVQVNFGNANGSEAQISPRIYSHIFEGSHRTSGISSVG